MIKRLSLSLMAVALIAMLVSAATFALFTSTTTNQANTFTAGTVTLSQVAGVPFTLSNIAPGDAGTAGTFTVAYTGSLNAWLGLTTSTSGDLFAGTTPLTVTITDGASNSYLANAANQVVGTAAVGTGTSVTFTVNYSMPLSAGNEYQGDAGTLNMEVKAVQAANNSTSSGPISWN
ncbi:MAG: TasA family protein [Bacillota bacterium]